VEVGLIRDVLAATGMTAAAQDDGRRRAGELRVDVELRALELDVLDQDIERTERICVTSRGPSRRRRRSLA
jgi:hypothetical protein